MNFNEYVFKYDYEERKRKFVKKYANPVTCSIVKKPRRKRKVIAWLKQIMN